MSERLFCPRDPAMALLAPELTDPFLPLLERRLGAGLVHAAFVLVDARACHFRLHTGQDAKLRLGKTRTTTCFGQSLGKDWARGIGHWAPYGWNHRMAQATTLSH